MHSKNFVQLKVGKVESTVLKRIKEKKALIPFLFCSFKHFTLIFFAGISISKFLLKQCQKRFFTLKDSSAPQKKYVQIKN